MTLLLALACKAPVSDPVVVPEFPKLSVRADHKALVLSRLDREPYAMVYATLLEHADAELPIPDPEGWDHDAFGNLGEIAHANAFLAWLHDDEERANRAKDAIAPLHDAFEFGSTWDINIRMPHPLMGYTNAHDLLRATPWFSEAEAADLETKITNINDAFFSAYLENEALRLVVLAPAQNNHPIRTATAIGYVAMAFPDHPRADVWANWAFSELDYLWGPDGHYVQPDGGVSEGPFYFGFAWGVTTAFSIAAREVALDRVFLRDCRNRSDVDPWTGHGCIEGEPFQWNDLLSDELYAKTVDWSIGLRLPSGQRPPLADGYFIPLNGGALMGEGYHRWDWETNTERPYEMGHGVDLVPHHLVWFDDAVQPEEPPFLNRFMPDAGNAVFRSDWGTDAVWMLLVAEAGSVRKTLHDHVDGTSFSMAAYGEYLLLDPGYYKPNELNNAVTSAPEAHNVILVDGVGAPAKGLLNDFGDTDAFLMNTVDGVELAYAEAHQSYEGVDIERSVVFVDQRWFVVADRVLNDEPLLHEYRWRLNGYAGGSSVGTFTLNDDGGTWERVFAGVDVHVASPDPGLTFEKLVGDPLEAPFVHEFDNERSVEDHAVMDAVHYGQAPDFLALLLPYPVDTPKIAAEALDLGPLVAAWRVEDWIVLQREEGAPTTFDIDGTLLATDGSVTVVRMDGGAGLVARGGVLRLDGVDIVDAVTVP